MQVLGRQDARIGDAPAARDTPQHDALEVGVIARSGDDEVDARVLLVPGADRPEEEQRVFHRPQAGRQQEHLGLGGEPQLLPQGEGGGLRPDRLRDVVHLALRLRPEGQTSVQEVLVESDEAGRALHRLRHDREVLLFQGELVEVGSGEDQ